jgi:hypothetical protein
LGASHLPPVATGCGRSAHERSILGARNFAFGAAGFPEQARRPQLGDEPITSSWLEVWRQMMEHRGRRRFATI